MDLYTLKVCPQCRISSNKVVHIKGSQFKYLNVLEPVLMQSPTYAFPTFLVGWLVGWFCFFETGFFCVALAVLELTL